MSSESPHLSRITRLLEEGAIPLEPLLSFVRAAGPENAFVGVGTLTASVQLLLPAHAIAAIDPSFAMPARSMLLVSAVAEEVNAGVVLGGAISTRDAVFEVAPAPARDAWLSIVETVTQGCVRNRTRSLTGAHSALTLMIPARDGPAETTFVRDLTELATRLRLPGMWRPLYEEAGAADADLGLITECTNQGVLPRLAFRFGATGWDRAIELVQAMADVTRARDAAVRMGTLAGAFEVDVLRSVDAVIDEAEPDLVVWIAPPPAG